MKKIISLAAAGALALSVSALYTPGDRAAGGAVIGGLAGAAIGGAATGRASGALAGAAVGAVGGAVVGAATAPAPDVCPRRLSRPDGPIAAADRPPSDDPGRGVASVFSLALVLLSPRHGLGLGQARRGGLGFAVGGPLGALLGGVAGHVLVDREGALFGPAPRELFSRPGSSRSSAKMAKSDGVVLRSRSTPSSGSSRSRPRSTERRAPVRSRQGDDRRLRGLCRADRRYLQGRAGAAGGRARRAVPHRGRGWRVHEAEHAYLRRWPRSSGSTTATSTASRPATSASGRSLSRARRRPEHIG